MSLKIITDLINFIKVKLNIDEENIIIQKIEIENDCGYVIDMKINGELYSIRHFEPLKMIQGVNYGMDLIMMFTCSIKKKDIMILFDKEKEYNYINGLNKIYFYFFFILLLLKTFPDHNT